LVPAVVAFWPLLVWLVYLPNAEESWGSEVKQYDKAQGLIAEILTLDPERLEFADAVNTEDQFDYAKAVATVAAVCGIPPGNYSHGSGIIIESGGQKSQTAKVDLNGIDIARSARFLSTMEFRWANLQCTQVKLTKKKAVADMWDVDLNFKYYY